jgi:feruloyl esterase
MSDSKEPACVGALRRMRPFGRADFHGVIIMNHRRFTLTTFLLAVVVVRAVPGLAATPCEDLTKLSLSETAVTSAQMVAAGAFTPPSGVGTRRGGEAQQQQFATLPAFCRVMLTAKPSRDSDIKIEVWLPESGWNGKLQAVGDGGLAGSIPVALMAPALAEGYATSGTDTGHVGSNANFMPGHPEKLVDFAYRSTHEMAVAAKAVIAAFYGKPPTWSYYNACSGGARHGLTSAQRYPADFQGIVAGAASWNQARLDAGRIGVNLAATERRRAGFLQASFR